MGGWVAALAAGVACAAPAAAHAATPVAVTSGPLTATVGTGAWRLELAQPGGPTLTEAPAARLGFRTALGAYHATAIRSVARDGDVARLVVATDDPLGRTLDVTLQPSGDGVVSLAAGVAGPPTGDVTALEVGFEAPRGERFFGFGERSNAVDQRGNEVENRVSDGPFSPGTRVFVAPTIPPQGFRARDDATYYPVPWLLSSRGYGVLVDNGETSTFDLARRDPSVWRVSVAARSVSLRFFAGPAPAAALRRFTAATGRQPAPAAPWAFGPWLQTGQPNAPSLAEQQADLDKLRAADAPVSAAETQLRYLPCGLDRGYEAYERDRVAFYHREGLAVLTYVNPMVCASYGDVFGPAAASGALQKTALGTPSLFMSFVGGIGPLGFTVQPVSQFDFTAPAGVEAYRRIIDRIVATGHDGWMEDFGEYTPDDAVSADGTPGAAMHNVYPRSYHCGVARIVGARPLVRFQRSGWTGAAACAQDVWGGDPTTGFGYDGLRSAVRQALSIGMSGVSRWGSDIGGYDTLADDPRLDDELLQRWIEVGAISAVMRMKKSGLAIPSYARPQPWDPANIAVWRKYTKLHTQLYPYLLAADSEYRRSGLPMMRALALVYPDDDRLAGVDDELMVGDDLLAAPVLDRGARRRDVRLPAGRWFDASRALRYDAAGDGAFHVAGGTALDGGGTVTADAPLDTLPLYVRAGAVLPLLPADVSTLSDHGDGVVHLRDRLGTLRLLAFPAPGLHRSAFNEDEGTSSRVRRGAWRLSIAGTRTRTYRLEAATSELRGRDGRRFRPCAVRLGRRPLSPRRWRFDRSRKLLTATFRARRATLSVSDRCGPAPARAR